MILTVMVVGGDCCLSRPLFYCAAFAGVGKKKPKIFADFFYQRCRNGLAVLSATTPGLSYLISH